MRVQERGVGRSEVGKQRVKVRREGSREGRVGEMHGLLSIDDGFVDVWDQEITF